MRYASVLLLLLFASPAAAEFTTSEKASVHNLLLGVNLIRSGLQDQVAANQYGGYYTAWQSSVDCHDALGYVLGTQIKQGDAARAELAAAPRSSWLARAWISLDRCASGLASAQMEATGITNKYGQARTVVLAFPRGGLSPVYQSPKPLTWPKVIGPHGDYDYAQEDAWFAVKYAHDSLYLWGSRYLCDAANYVTIIMGALANVRFTASETADGFDSTTRDTIDNVLWLQKFALEDTAVKYLAASMNEYAVATSLSVLPAIVKHADSWKNLDRSIRNTVCLDGRVACDRTPH